MVSIKTLSNYKAVLGEGPLYDPGLNRVYWVDINVGRINYVDLDSGREGFIKTPDVVTSIQLREGGGLIITMRHGFYAVNIDTGQVRVLAEVETDMPMNRFNDGKCDAEGRYWAGTMDINENAPTGSLYVLDLDGKVRKVLDGLTISNGIAWSLDNKTMYLIDTPTLNVYAFDFDLKNGFISNRRVIINFRNETGKPDGMTIDSEGMIWIAHARGGRVSRWDPVSGRKLLEIGMPASGTTSVIFGGKDLGILFVTTASILSKQEELFSGYLYTIEGLNIKGITPYTCKL
nr:MAG: gluconolaconase [Vulcanisaeta sp. AZ3]